MTAKEHHESTVAQINATHRELYEQSVAAYIAEAHERAQTGLPPLPFPFPARIQAVQELPDGGYRIVETNEYVAKPAFQFLRDEDGKFSIIFDVEPIPAAIS